MVIDPKCDVMNKMDAVKPANQSSLIAKKDETLSS